MVGPTASGKTALAIRLAQALCAPVVSFDSRQFYREMSIGTAKPTTEELSQAPHYFIGNLSIEDDYSVGRYEEDCTELLERLFQTCRTVVMVGGSGLYLNAVIKGMDRFPDIDPSVREQVKALFRDEGIEALNRVLQEKDPAYYQKVDRNNPHRLIRAVEVCLGTGRPYSDFITGEKPDRYPVLKVGIDYPREELYRRIDLRVDLMLEQGLLDEVKALFPYRSLNALQTVGYREFFDWMEGKTTHEEAIAKVKQNTRNYAKRQLTWFRRDKNTVWLSPEKAAVWQVKDWEK